MQKKFDETINQIIDWAQADDNIQALLSLAHRQGAYEYLTNGQTWISWCWRMILSVW